MGFCLGYKLRGIYKLSVNKIGKVDVNRCKHKVVMHPCAEAMKAQGIV